MNGTSFKKKSILLILGVMLFTTHCMITSCSSEKNVNQRRVEKGKVWKDKEARKKYEQAIKRHEKNQSPSTRSMMKEAKKETPKNTPLKHSSGKKCK